MSHPASQQSSDEDRFDFYALRKVQRKLGLINSIAEEISTRKSEALLVRSKRPETLNSLVGQLSNSIENYLSEFEADELVEMWSELHRPLVKLKNPSPVSNVYLGKRAKI